MVPGSTLRYGSHFCRVTLNPRLSRRQPIEEAATPFPSEETTPPVTKIYFGAIHAARIWLRSFQPPSLFALRRSDVHAIMVGTRGSVKSNFLMPRKRKTFPICTGETFLRQRCSYRWEVPLRRRRCK